MCKKDSHQKEIPNSDKDLRKEGDAKKDKPEHPFPQSQSIGSDVKTHERC